MIRDPSDGTVKETLPEAPKPPAPAAPLLETGTSGLPAGSKKSKDVLRLEASRQWLKNYLAAKATPPETELQCTEQGQSL